MGPGAPHRASDAGGEAAEPRGRLPAADRGGRPLRDGLALAAHQFRYEQRVFWRNPASVFFTVAFPIMLLLIFATIFGNEVVEGRGGVRATTYYVPAITVVAVISATYVNLGINLTRVRERGVLKRLRGTPLPPWALVAGRVGNSLIISLLMVGLVIAIGRIVYGVSVPVATLPAVIVALTVGAAAFCCLGFAICAAIPSEDAAPAITNATALPLYFISGVFIPDSEIPAGVLRVADAFPVRHFFEAFFAAFEPAASAPAIEIGHLAVVAAWGLGGLLAAVLWFRWTPRRG